MATGSAQLGVNVVNIAGQAAALDANNLLKVDLVDIAGAAVATGTAQLGVNVVTQANIDFGATQKASITAAVPTAAAIQSGLATPTNITAGTVSDKTGYALTAGEHTNIGTDVYGQLNTAVTDATSLNANSLLDRLRSLGWIIRNQIAITDASGAGTIYKDDSATTAFSVSLTDNSTTTTRTRAA